MSLNDGEAERLLTIMQGRNEGIKALKEVVEQRERQRKLKETMMYKNAGIKSKKEAAQRLISGEVFIFNGCKVLFNAACDSPFRLAGGSLDMDWHSYPEWCTKTEWYEDLGEGVLCWVWDKPEDKGLRVGIVVDYKEYESFKFYTKSRFWYRDAEPITKEEAKKFIWGANDE